MKKVFVSIIVFIGLAPLLSFGQSVIQLPTNLAASSTEYAGAQLSAPGLSGFTILIVGTLLALLVLGALIGYLQK